VGVRPVPNLLRILFASVGLDWARAQVPLPSDRIDQTTGCWSVAHPHRPSQRRNFGINQL